MYGQTETTGIGITCTFSLAYLVVNDSWCHCFNWYPAKSAQRLWVSEDTNFAMKYRSDHDNFLVLVLGGWSPEREGSMGIPTKDPGYDIAVRPHITTN